MSRITALLLALLLAATPALAQEPATGGSKPLIKYGKWVLAAGALGMNLLAARAHNRADDNFHALEQRCLADDALCDLDASGRYVDAQSEDLYQTSLHYDRQARRWLFGGEGALAGAAALFVWELTRRTPKPDNIPFEPEVRSLREATGVGLKVAF
ncbi:MAG TPA: hypothetical protein VJQ46_00775 [Gemmatimonadales bacterium]|nr:hypothetical protein [Gemmatimonadales bacterium]